MRALLFVAGSSLGILLTVSAAAEDSPATPPDTASPPEPVPSAPPTEPAPPPAAPPTPAAPPSAAPPAEPPSTPPPAQPPPAKKGVAPADVTLEETPEGPSATTPPTTKARPLPKRRPKADVSEPSEPEPVPAAEKSPEQSPGAAPAEGEESESQSKKAEGEESEAKSKKDEGEGLLGPFRIGGLVGVGLPSILSFGGMIKLTRYFGAGINVGLIPAVKLSFYGEADLSYQEYDIYGRLFPFGGALFAGAGVGYASVKGTFQSSYDTSSLQAQARSMGIPLPPNLPNPVYIESNGSVRVLVLTPTIGLLHTFGSGFTIGIDVGAQIPIAPSDTHFDTVVPPQVPQQFRDQYITPNDQKVQDTLNSLSRTVIPTLNLRVGWLI